LTFWVTLESAIVTYVTIGVILVICFAVLSRTNISLAALRRSRRKQVIEEEDDEDILNLSEEEVIRITDLGSKVGEHVLELTLNNMRGPVCPYVALWKY